MASGRPRRQLSGLFPRPLQQVRHEGPQLQRLHLEPQLSGLQPRRVDQILARVDSEAELEIIRYAA